MLYSNSEVENNTTEKQRSNEMKASKREIENLIKMFAKMIDFSASYSMTHDNEKMSTKHSDKFYSLLNDMKKKY